MLEDWHIYYLKVQEHREASRTIGTIRDDRGPYGTIRDHTGPYGSIQDHIRQYRTV